MEGPVEKHLSEDLLELYALGRLAGGELAGVEEHPLVCEDCRDRLKEVEDYAGAMREALRKTGGPC